MTSYRPSGIEVEDFSHVRDHYGISHENRSCVDDGKPSSTFRAGRPDVESVSTPPKQPESSTEVDSQLTDSLSQNSLDLFPQCEASVENISSDGSAETECTSVVDIEECLNTTPSCSGSLGPLKPGPQHTVLFKPHIRPGEAPLPYPDAYRDRWDADYVRLPCSPENLFPVEDKDGNRNVESRWELIQRSLLGNISSTLDVEEAIMQYNSQYTNRWDFRGLHAFFTEVLEPVEVTAFFRKTFPAMIKLALQLPSICTQPPPLLKVKKNHTVTLSQKQIASLLANAFFCTFPRRNAPRRNSEYSTYPDINFNRLFVGSKQGLNHRKVEKLKCIMNYFRRVTSNEPVGTVSFERRHLEEFPVWAKSNKFLRMMIIKSTGLIECDGKGMLQVDFANKFVGGGVLGQGCVQEEIRFLICPELLVSRLFTECLSSSEVLIVTGCEQFNGYSGYADSFTWTGDYVDPTPRDEWGRRCTQVVAMDAIHFYRRDEQYKPSWLEREVNKAYCGFCEPSTDASHLSAVATGNWGCGAFRGDPRLKALIQLVAASQAERDLLYFTFGDQKLKEDIATMYSLLVQKGVTISDLWMILLQYHSLHSSKGSKVPLYEFISRIYSCSESEADRSSSSDDTISCHSIRTLSPKPSLKESSCSAVPCPITLPRTDRTEVTDKTNGPQVSLTSDELSTQDKKEIEKLFDQYRSSKAPDSSCKRTTDSPN